MIIGYLGIEIYFPYSHSLKEKRKRLKSYQWQRAKIGIVIINNKQALIEKVFKQLIREAEESIEGEIIHKEIDFFK